MDTMVFGIMVVKGQTREGRDASICKQMDLDCPASGTFANLAYSQNPWTHKKFANHEELTFQESWRLAKSGEEMGWVLARAQRIGGFPSPTIKERIRRFSSASGCMRVRNPNKGRALG